MKRRTFFKLASIAPFVRAPKGAAATPEQPTVSSDTTRYLRGDSAWQSLRYITVMIGGVPRKLLVSE